MRHHLSILPQTASFSQSSHNSVCPKCGNASSRLGAGKAPGQSSLLCGNGHFQRWLNASEAKAIAKQLNQQGGR